MGKSLQRLYRCRPVAASHRPSNKVVAGYNRLNRNDSYNIKGWQAPDQPAALPKRGRSWSQQGSVLFIALWSLLILSIFALQLGFIVRQKITLVHRLDNRDNLYYIAAAGVNMAMAELRREDQTPDYDSLNESWSNNSKLFTMRPVGKGNFTVSYDYIENQIRKTTYGIRDEENKININTAKVNIIAKLIQIVGGLDQPGATSLAYAMIDWRDEDSFFQHPQYGAEDGDYHDLKSPYDAKDSDYEVFDELLLVKGMTPDILDKIKDYITIYGEGKININTTSREVFMALGLDRRLIDYILFYRNGEDLMAGTEDDNVFIQPQEIVSKLSQTYPLSPSDIAKLSNLVATDSFTTKSDHFMIRSLARLNNKKQQAEVTAVVNRYGEIQYWREKY
jgi:general secretion pathway protein K